MSKISNVITMLELLNSGRKYSIKELSEILEVTPRMVRVYKEELEKANIFIDTIRGPYGGYILNKKVSLPTRENNPSKLDMSTHDKRIYNIMAKAINEKRKVKIKYDNKGKISERIIHPQEIYVYNNEWFAPSYCELRHDIRNFAFSSITNIILLDILYE